MRKLFIFVLMGLICLSSIGQDLNLSVVGSTYKIANDTLYIEKKIGESLTFSVVYQITGINQPIRVDVTEVNRSTIPARTISSNAFPGHNNFVAASSYSDRIDFNLPAATTYSKYDYVEFLFKWPDLLKLGQEKEKRLVIKIHQRKTLDWVADVTNTSKLEIIQYTDFLGINSDRPNGVFQQQLLFKWPIVKSYWNISKNLKVQPFRSVLIPNILLNRIDKAKDDSSILVPLGISIVPPRTGGVSDTIANVVGSFDLIRYANTIIESSVNLFTVHLDKTRIYLQYDFGLLRNRILDSISQDKAVSRPIYSYLTGWHLYAKSLLDPKAELNIEVEFGSRRVNLQDNFFKQYDIYAFENGSVRSIRFPVRTPDETNKSKPIYFSSVKLSKDWGKESTNYVFFRLKYQWQKGTYKFVYKDLPRNFQTESFYNHFFQVNLGVSLGLEDLFKKR